MAEEKSTRNPGRDAGFFILFLIILGIIWFASGGPGRMSLPNGPFLNTLLGPSGNFSALNSPGENNISGSGSLGTKVYLSSAGASQSDPSQEYIEITAASDQLPLDISQWTLEGKDGLKIKIATGVELFLSGQIGEQRDTLLSAGQTAVIVTGRSPVGTGFRVNKCSGYLSQYQTFYPPLATNCPYPRNEDWPADLSADCLDYIGTLSSCQINLFIPPFLGDKCTRAINDKISYNACVNNHKDDGDFYKPEWRIYLGRGQQLWRDSYETIILRDAGGNEISRVSY